MAKKQAQKSAKAGVRRRVRKRIHWTKELLALLGQLPDAVMAKRTGLSRWTVSHERTRRGIPAFRPRGPDVEWTPEMIAALGTDSDGNVAAMLGVSRFSVAIKRRKLQIPPFHPPPHDGFQGYPWGPEDLALLGKVPDRALADVLGLTRTTVTSKRLELGTPAFYPRAPRIRWTAEKISRLGEAPDTKIAAELGISESSVLLKRQELGIPAAIDTREIVRDDELVELLRLPTSEACRLSGLSPTSIYELRRELGLQVRGKPPRRDRGAPGQPAWSAEEIQLLGAAPDREVARRIGRSAPAVFAKRRSLGLLSWGATRRSLPIEVELLGKLPDTEIAARSGRSPGSVRELRRALGIAAWRPIAKWRPEEVELLGAAADAEIAERLGRSEESVRGKRKRLGIRGYGPYDRWRPEDLELLGTLPDSELAKRFGRSPDSVRKKRWNLAIPVVATVRP